MQEDADIPPLTSRFISPRLIGILGALAFITGITLAILSGWLWPHSGHLAAAIVILGVVVGLLNITGREVIPFLIAGVALVVIGQGDVFKPLNDLVADLGTIVDGVVTQIALFAAPAALVNAIRVAVALGRPTREP